MKKAQDRNVGVNQYCDPQSKGILSLWLLEALGSLIGKTFLSKALQPEMHGRVFAFLGSSCA